MNVQVCHCGWSKCTTYHGLRVHQGKMGCTPKGMHIPKSEQVRFSRNVNHVGPQIKIQEPFVDVFKSSVDSFFETPRRSHQTTVSRINDSGACRVLNFSVPRQQVAQFMELSATAALQAPIRPIPIEMEKDDKKEKITKKLQKVAQFMERSATAALQAPIRPIPIEMEKDDKKEKIAKKLQKARQEKMKADLQQKIHIREHKMAEVRSSVIDCKGSLDTEWLEVNNIFLGMIKVVEDAQQKALRSLEERKLKVKNDEHDVIVKLQREINVLKKAIDESEKNPDLEVSPLMGLNDSEWKNICVDTSLSFGTLRAVTSTMMKQIQQEIEKLSSIELERISAFAMDVKLDPATAHQSLVLSADGKKVSDVGKTAEGPDSPQRFDMFGSVLGFNRLTSGKSYWEVEVSDKTGWDLGVARRNANRKGILSLNPDSGYWVAVHYEGEKYAALTAPPVCLSLKEKPQKVGVFVDYEEGLVSFYDVTSQSHIFSFTQCAFGGEILPYFSPHLKENEKNTAPLIISAVQKQR